MKSIIKMRIFFPFMIFAFVPSANAVVATSTFQVQITITASCVVTTGGGANINLGSVGSTATNTTGNSSFTVQCSRTTPYFIGLAPSTVNGGNTTGAGSMSSVDNSGTNSDKVPYQLHQTSGTGPVWGNTATTSAVGNGVGGTGSGVAQTYTVYAVAASANFAPDSYADTVTINVNY